MMRQKPATLEREHIRQVEEISSKVKVAEQTKGKYKHKYDFQDNENVCQKEAENW